MALLHKLGVREIIEGLAAKQFSVSEVVADQLKQIERNEFNAFVYNDFAQTKQQAAAMDARIAAKEHLPLNGVMVGVKDLFCMRNVKTTACSRVLENFVPPYESTTTQRLWENGAVFGGKLNMDEFAMGSTTMHSIFGYAINPWSKKHGKELVPGGSSGGSAAAVASFSVPAALGSDTGGSIRQPASFCGVVGIKPTYGRCSRWGMVAFASSLDCPGVFARNVEDTALVFNAIAGFDAKDSTTFQVPTSNYSSAINDGVKGLRIGLPKQYFKDLKFAPEIDEITKQAIKIFEDNGAIIKEISIPTIPHSLLIYYIISSVEAVSNLSRYDGVRYGLHVEPEGAGFESINDFYAANRTKGFGNEVKNRLLMGGKILNSELSTGKYKHAQAVRRMLIKEFDSVFKDVDCILSPVAPIPAFGVEEEIDELTMYKNDLLTTPANMAGLPAISVPVALTKDHRPVGMQLMGRYFDEATLFKAAKALENVVGFDKILQENLLQE